MLEIGDVDTLLKLKINVLWIKRWMCCGHLIMIIFFIYICCCFGIKQVALLFEIIINIPFFLTFLLLLLANLFQWNIWIEQEEECYENFGWKTRCKILLLTRAQLHYFSGSHIKLLKYYPKFNNKYKLLIKVKGTKYYSA